jgi:putative DNA-binding protein
VLTLAEIQAGIRDALVDGNGAAVARVLLGGSRPAQRLAIHQRHYVASLTRALVERFPATVWLVGSELVTHVATAFIRKHPPVETVRR